MYDLGLNWGIALALGIMAILTTVLSILVGLALYFLFSYGLFSMAKKREMQNPWMAFIPLANVYMLGTMIGPYTIQKITVQPPGIILITAVVFYVGLSFVPVLSSILAPLALVVILFGLHILYTRLDGANAFLYTILSAVAPILAIPILFFILRNK